MRSDCLYSSSHPRSSHFNPSKMELTEASVLRPTSVSSRRRIMVPPWWRAYSQLKMNVRALPTCRKPVGEGAKRTRGPIAEICCVAGEIDDGLIRESFAMVRAREKHRQARRHRVHRVGIEKRR